MIMFIYLNDHELELGEDEFFELTMGVASGATSKADVAVLLASRIR